MKSIGSALQSVWDSVLQPVVRKAGIDVRRYEPGDEIPRPQLLDVLLRLERIPKVPIGSRPTDIADFVAYCAREFERSSSQSFQDLFVLHPLEEKRSGYFVEFGATDGVSISNSKLLEDAYAWDGILAEPARSWHERLARNRSCAVDYRCVWSRSGEKVSFREVDSAELSTIDLYRERDMHANARQAGSTYDVETVSLTDLLRAHSAPPAIDYLSIDTEGSEFAILEAFDFRSYDISVITVEHNYTSDRDRIHRLLTSKGYLRRFEALSRWDDWYVRA